MSNTAGREQHRSSSVVCAVAHSLKHHPLGVHAVWSAEHTEINRVNPCSLETHSPVERAATVIGHGVGDTRQTRITGAQIRQITPPSRGSLGLSANSIPQSHRGPRPLLSHCSLHAGVRNRAGRSAVCPGDHKAWERSKAQGECSACRMFCQVPGQAAWGSVSQLRPRCRKVGSV